MYKKIKAIIISLFILLILSSCNNTLADNSIIKNTSLKKATEEEIIDNKIKSMTLYEKIGQTLILGFEGQELNDDLKNIILDIKPSGIIYFGKNIKDKDQVINLNKDIINLNKDNIPLFIAIDEEGGLVSRLSSIYGKLPAMKSLGDKNNLDISNDFGKILALRLKILGFNLDFAPVLDINSNPKNPVIGTRAFSNDKEIVAKNAMSLVDGLTSYNIISSVKHFPGHGDTSTDSHKEIPVVNKSKEEIANLELYPFKEAIKNNIPMIMISHVLYPSYDSENVASLSSNIKEELLRKELNFKGLIVSDDLTMKAITKNKSVEEATFEYLKSGGDIALICHNTKSSKEIVEYVKKQIELKNFSEKELNKKVKRILTIKKKYHLKNEFIEDENLEKNLIELQKNTLDKI